MSKPTTHVAVEPFDLAEAVGLLEEILDSLKELDGVTPPQPNGSSPGSGEVSRDLLNLADQSTLVGGLIRNQYWQWKRGLSL